MNYEQALAYLYAIEQKGIKLGLSRMQALLQRLGNPEQGLPYIHVAGTEGKGSVCAMLEQTFLEAGYRVGKYISPHLKDFTERMTLNGKEIPKADVVRLLENIKPVQENASYFEIVTAMAFLYFQEKKPDVVILEVGLGGRLDATNVITPLVSVITNISLEHTDILGNTVEKIAKEKAGIIKKGIPVITVNTGKALTILQRTCRKKQASLMVIKKKYNGKIGLKGAFQKENAALAYAAAKLLKKKYGFSFTESRIRAGIAKAKWPGRMDLRGKVLFDCAHTEEGFKALRRALKKMKYDKLVLVFGLLKDKRMEAMLAQIVPLANVIILTKPNSDRARGPEEIAAAIQKKCKIMKNAQKALQHAKSIAGKQDLIVVTGSIYLVGELLPSL